LSTGKRENSTRVDGYSIGADIQQRCRNQFSDLTKNEAATAKYLKALPVLSAISEETL
jgi:hypothetical protein